MERMTEFTDDMKYIIDLEEENKKLKSDLGQYSEAYKRYRDFEKEELAESCYDLEKENKKLKEEVKYYKDKSEFLNNVIVKYQEENKQLKDELEKLKSTYIYDAKQVRDIC